MKYQIRTPSNAAIWNSADLDCREVHFEGRRSSHLPCVEWNGKYWLRKRKEITLCEIVGYQLAEALNIPLLEWVAFFDDEPKKGIIPAARFGMLIRRWDEASGQLDLSEPSSKFPNEVAAGLALGAFDRFEWPVWLTDDQTIRLIDLERVGPVLSWPPQHTRFGWYGKDTERDYNEALRAAREDGVEAQFRSSLRNLMYLDLSQAVDLSGHEHSVLLKKTIVQGLELRQWELRRILDGVIMRKRHAPIRRKPSTPRRCSKEFEVTLDHGKMGRLRGSLSVKPIPRGKWQTSWNIGEIDRECDLSDRWFFQDCYRKRMDALLIHICEKAKLSKLQLETPVYMRWGSIIGLSQQQGLELVQGIQELWKQIIEEWKTHRLHAPQPTY